MRSCRHEQQKLRSQACVCKEASEALHTSDKVIESLVDRQPRPGKFKAQFCLLFAQTLCVSRSSRLGASRALEQRAVAERGAAEAIYQRIMLGRQRASISPWARPTRCSASFVCCANEWGQAGC